ncbi:MAG: hypothetical protein Q9M37_04715 [Desulfonauticus sp.]|nr:hypothetical protein [Desulfonauticus sp.]
MFDKFRQFKDKTTSRLLLEYLNKKIEPYGQCQEVRFDSKIGQFELKLLLKGETEPVVISVLGCKLIEDGLNHYLAFEKICVSKKWMELLLNTVLLPKYLESKQIAIPSEYVLVLKLVGLKKINK